MTNVTIYSFGDYNQRRYGRPWVATVDAKGKPDFTIDVGTFTGNHYNGDGGDLIVFEPIIGKVYAFGQKDYRKASGTQIEYRKWDGEKFIECDKLGRALEQEDQLETAESSGVYIPAGAGIKIENVFLRNNFPFTVILWKNPDGEYEISEYKNG